MRPSRFAARPPVPNAPGEDIEHPLRSARILDSLMRRLAILTEGRFVP
jgi:hypothetical protein